MSFIWPAALLLLLLVPVGVAVHRRIGQRRLRRLTEHGGLGIAAALRKDIGRGARLRQRTSAVFLVLGVAIMVVALARPQMAVSMPRLESTVILVFDVSGSMAATDIAPTRMEAAKAAAREFVERQPETVDVGIVAFSSGALSVHAPSNDPVEAVAAINRLAPTRATSVGQGIVVALDAIAAQKAESSVDYYTNRAAPGPSPTPVPEGTYDSSAIVLLTDGENNLAPDPLEAAQAAADRGVRIFTVGIGSAEGAILRVNGFTVHTQLNEPELQQIAELTHGRYFNAQSAQDLASVYDELHNEIAIEEQEIEITPIVAGASLLTLLLGALSSLLWLGRMP
jgi:Ca-activated chloride channel family protein